MAGRAAIFTMMKPSGPPPTSYYLDTWGYNNAGQLGQGDTTNRSTPTQVGTLTNWAIVSSGSALMAAIKTDGTLWTWGNNASGQLGQGDVTNRSTPTQIGSLTTWSSVSCGSDFVIAVKTDGTLWGWGDNNRSMLGVGDTVSRSTPVQIGSATNWLNSTISCGVTTVLAVKTDGTLSVWGFNYRGGLGNGLTSNTNTSTPTQLGTLTNWKQVSVNSGYSALAVKTDGTLWGWGWNSGGELGLGDTTVRSSPVQVGTLTNWSYVSMGSDGILGFTSAVKTDGTLWTWGTNVRYEQGNGGNTATSSPTQAGSSTNWKTTYCNNTQQAGAIKTDGTLWTWGFNYRGGLGNGLTSNTNTSTPTQVGTLTTWTLASAGGYFALGIHT